MILTTCVLTCANYIFLLINEKAVSVDYNKRFCMSCAPDLDYVLVRNYGQFEKFEFDHLLDCRERMELTHGDSGVEGRIES